MLLPALLAHIPDEFNRYYEPFLGGGALFFACRPARATLSDTNADLINCYECVRAAPEDVIRCLKSLPNNKRTYLEVRDWQPRSPVKRAARFIYLATLSFNGIYRVSLKGKFNVPYGKKTHLDVAQAHRIRNAARALKGVSLECADFEDSLAGARRGDLVYLDPPYTVAHGANGFLKYNARIFSWADQTRLAKTAHDLARRGCHVLITNACHPSLRELYSGMTQIEVSRHSRIAPSVQHRRRVSELIISNLA